MVSIILNGEKHKFDVEYIANKPLMSEDLKFLNNIDLNSSYLADAGILGSLMLWIYEKKELDAVGYTGIAAFLIRYAIKTFRRDPSIKGELDNCIHVLENK